MRGGESENALGFPSGVFGFDEGYLDRPYPVGDNGFRLGCGESLLEYLGVMEAGGDFKGVLVARNECGERGGLVLAVANGFGG